MELKLALKVDDLDNVATIFADDITDGTVVEVRNKKGGQKEESASMGMFLRSQDRSDGHSEGSSYYEIWRIHWSGEHGYQKGVIMSMCITWMH